MAVKSGSIVGLGNYAPTEVEELRVGQVALAVVCSPRANGELVAPFVAHDVIDGRQERETRFVGHAPDLRVLVRVGAYERPIQSLAGIEIGSSLPDYGRMDQVPIFLARNLVFATQPVAFEMRGGLPAEPTNVSCLIDAQFERDRVKCGH